MSISPWYIGQTLPQWAFTWNDDSSQPVNLTGATVTLRFEPDGGTAYAAGGTVTVTNASAGQFTYPPQANDFSAEGTYKIQAVATYPGGVLKADIQEIRVIAAV